MWWMGDSQTTHFYQAAECFLREFAADPRLERRWAGRYASGVAAGVTCLSQAAQPSTPLVPPRLGACLWLRGAVVWMFCRGSQRCIGLRRSPLGRSSCILVCVVALCPAACPSQKPLMSS